MTDSTRSPLRPPVDAERMLAQLPAVVFSVAPDAMQTITFITPGAEALFGYRPDEICHDPTWVARVADPAVLEPMVARAKAWREAGAAGRFDARIPFRRKDEGWCTVDARVCALHDRDGRLAAFVGTFTDVTEQLATETALADLDALLLEVASVNLEIARADAFDARLGDLFGRLGRAAQVDRVYLFELTDVDTDRPLAHQRLEWTAAGVRPEIDNPQLQDLDLVGVGYGGWVERLRQDRPVYGIVEMTPPEGRALLREQGILSLLALPVIVEGQLSAFVGFDDCHTAREWHESEVAILKLSASALGELLERERVREERRRAEAVTIAHQRHLQKLTAHVPGLIYQFRLRPDGTAELPYANAGLDDVFGRELPPDHQAAPILETIHPDDVAMVQRTIAESAATLSHWVCRFRVQHPRKGLIWVEGHSAPEREADGSVLWHGYATDITSRVADEGERIELERRLLHAQKLESLGILAGGIAHDFNNLLLAVLGNLDLALLDLDDEAPARAGVSEAVAAARRAADLTRQMLAYSGRGMFVVKSIDFNAVVAENVNLLRAIVPRTVSIELALAPGLPAVVADPGQLQQVVMNLITNAAEALGDRPGLVTLSTGVASFDESTLIDNRLDNSPRPGRYVWFAVEDTGCGMTPAVLARIFDPFFTTKFTGRGLGMPAVQGIVKAHGGAILIDSRPDVGSTLRVLLPVEDVAAPPDAPPDPAAASATIGVVPTSATVLVVDDEAPVRRLIDQTLRREGYRTLLAGDGAEALVLFDVHRDDIDLVILDLTMPTMDGETTLQHLRGRAPGLRVILASGFGEQEVHRRFGSEAPTSFLQKPFRRGALLDAVARALGATQNDLTR